MVGILAILIGKSVDRIPAIDAFTLRGHADDEASSLAPDSAAGELHPVSGEAGSSPVGMGWRSTVDAGGELFVELAEVGVKSAIGLSSEWKQTLSICVDFHIINAVLKFGGAVGGDKSRVEVLGGGDFLGDVADDSDVHAGELGVFSKSRGNDVIAFLIVFVITTPISVGSSTGSAENTTFYLGRDANASDSAVDDKLDNFMTVGEASLMIAVVEMITGGLGEVRGLGAGAVDGCIGESKNRLNGERQVLAKHNDDFFVFQLQARLGRESVEDEGRGPSCVVQKLDAVLRGFGLG